MAEAISTRASSFGLRAWVDDLSRRPNYKWVVIGLLFFAGFLNLEDRVVINSIMPLIRQDLHMSSVFAGALMTVFLWTYAAASPIAGYVGDRMSRKKVIVSCLALWSVVTTLAGLVNSGGQLMATRVLLGLTESFYIPASLAIVADFHSPATRAKAIAVLVVGMNLGPIVGGYGAGLIGQNYGWRATLVVLGLLGVALAIILALFLRDKSTTVSPGDAPLSTEPVVKAAGFGETLLHLARTPSVMAMMLAVGLFAVGVWTLVTWLPPLLYERFNMSLADAGGLGALATTGPVFFSALIGSPLSDHFGAKNPKRRLLLFIIFYTCTLPFPLLFRGAEHYLVILGSVFCFQLSRGLGELNSHPLFFELIPARMRSTAIGVQNCFNCALGGVGPLVAGYYRESLGLQGVFGMVPFVILVSILLLLLAYIKFLPRDLARSRQAGNPPSTPQLAHL